MSTAQSEKPLDKMTVKELREIAKEFTDITGVHGKNKAELLAAVKQARGIKEKPRKNPRSVRAMKKAIRALREKQAQAIQTDNPQLASIYRRKISRLKKKTRRVA